MNYILLTKYLFKFFFVAVMNCRNLLALDVLSKSSDPYVKIEFQPKNLFLKQSVKETKIIYKDTNPVFDEYFSL